jgi:hypothetical protein
MIHDAGDVGKYTKKKTKGSWEENRDDCAFCFQGLSLKVFNVKLFYSIEK